MHERRMVFLDDRVGASLAVPLESAHRKSGVLAVVRGSPHVYTVEEVYRVTAAGARMTAAVESD